MACFDWSIWFVFAPQLWEENQEFSRSQTSAIIRPNFVHKKGKTREEKPGKERREKEEKKKENKARNLVQARKFWFFKIFRF